MAIQRAILHVDMDAFYASVEQRDHPELRGKPVIVGGAGPRGVVAAASYEVRRYGVFSAMPVARALRMCPDAVIVRPRMAVYSDESSAVFEIFQRYTPMIEPLSLDEAFLDVTGSRRLLGDALTIARAIRADIARERRLTASVGVAPNKFLAKLASDMDKPDGLTVVPDAVQPFLDPLPVRRIFGIGPKAAAKLKQIRVETIGDLRRADPQAVKVRLGTHAGRLLNLARGIDDRPVISSAPAKSVSHETTFDTDLTEAPDCRRRLLALSEAVGRRLRRKRLMGSVVFVKIRDGRFRTWSRQQSLADPVSDDHTISRTAWALFDQWWQHSGPRPIRLLGVGLSQLVAATGAGLIRQGSESLDALKDQVAERFADAPLTPASLVKPRSDGST